MSSSVRTPSWIGVARDIRILLKRGNIEINPTGHQYINYLLLGASHSLFHSFIHSYTQPLAGFTYI